MDQRGVNLTAFRGVFVIPVTPFDHDGKIDEQGLRRCVEFCIAAGAHGIVAPVVASEFSTLSDEERLSVAAIVTETARHRVPVVIGVSGTSGHHAATFARHAREIGADAVIAMPPYVQRATPAGILAYFRMVAAAAGLPVIIQNFGGPGGTPLPAPALVELVQQVDGAVYIKEETGTPGQVMTTILEAAEPRLRGVMGGMAGRFLLDEYRRGACGTMPACEVTDIHVAIWNALETGDEPGARRIFNRLLPLLNLEMLYGVPVCKEVLRRRGIIRTTTIRTPGTARLDAFDHAELDTILADLGSLFTTAPLTTRES